VIGANRGRYVRRGGPIPQIYPDTLAGLEQALKDCVTSSRFLPDNIIYLVRVRKDSQDTLRVFQSGQDITPYCETGE
jgi:hypothetical protein